MSKQKVIIIGAGLAGSLMAIYLAKKDIEADIYEARGDMRKGEMAAGRSINLALSDRGIAALRQIGMDGYMLREAVPMFGRMIHATDGQTKLLPYSGRQGEYINSVSRAGLNIALMNEAEKYAGVRFYFDEKCVDFDCKTGEAIFESGKITKGDTLIATDGAGSAVRKAMLDGGIPRFDFSQSWLEHGYKELYIPPVRTGSGSDLLSVDFHELNRGVQPPIGAGGSDLFQMEKNALHIWARGKFMMIALPNFDGSFTCTLFLAHTGENSFESLVRTGSGSDLLNGNLEKSNDKVTPLANAGGSDKLLEFFQTNFADAISLMPTLTEDFSKNPIGNLGTIKCFPWNVGGKSLLLGDSAHAVVPFYGQGMNCAFEDCRVLDSLIERHGTNWEKVFTEYGDLRKENTDAIAQMAEENFYEMRDSVANPVFVRKRELETRLEQTFPDYFSKYSMVTFREDLPYSVAKQKGNAQDKLLMKICAEIDDVSKINLNKVMQKIKTL